MSHTVSVGGKTVSIIRPTTATLTIPQTNTFLAFQGGADTSVGKVYLTQDNGTTWSGPVNVGDGGIITAAFNGTTALIMTRDFTNATSKGLFYSISPFTTWTHAGDATPWPPTGSTTVPKTQRENPAIAVDVETNTFMVGNSDSPFPPPSYSWTSTDGATWTQGGDIDVAFNDPRAFVSVGSGEWWAFNFAGSSKYIRKTVDGGITWVDAASGSTPGSYTVINNSVVQNAAGKFIIGGQGDVWSFNEGDSVPAVQSTIPNSIQTLAYNDDKSIIIYGDNPNIRRSIDGGLTWSTISLAGSFKVAYAQANGFLAIDSASSNVRTSPDGLNWTSTTPFPGGSDVVLVISVAVI